MAPANCCPPYHCLPCRRTAAHRPGPLLACWQDTVVAVRKAGDQLVVCNVDKDKYPEKTFSVDPAQASRCFLACLSAPGKLRVQGNAGSPLLRQACILGTVRLACCNLLRPPTHWQEVDVGKHNWGNYFVAAYKVASGLACRGMGK